MTRVYLFYFFIHLVLRAITIDIDQVLQRDRRGEYLHYPGTVQTKVIVVKENEITKIGKPLS